MPRARFDSLCMLLKRDGPRYPDSGSFTLLDPPDASIDTRIFASRRQNICERIISASLISATKKRFQAS